jgi:hypothetical protein
MKWKQEKRKNQTKIEDDGMRRRIERKKQDWGGQKKLLTSCEKTLRYKSKIKTEYWREEKEKESIRNNKRRKILTRRRGIATQCENTEKKPEEIEKV